MNFTVVIPTYNRWPILELNLKGFLGQNAFDRIKEIIIIDDGSTDEPGSSLHELIRSTFLPIHILHQVNKGPAAARNLGIQKALGEILFFTGDDIIPDKNLIKQHFDSHQRNHFNAHIAVLGKTVWPPHDRITPFMNYIQEKGFQFGYSLIKDENNVPFNFFYTSNISIHRDFLLKGKSFFDTDFPYAAFEDVDLAYRLKKRELRIVYNREAVGYHHHPVSVASFRKRQELSGYSAYIFFMKHPELDAFLGIRAAEKASILFDIAAKGVEPFCLLADKFLPFAIPVFYELVMQYYYKKGIRKYKQMLLSSKDPLKKYMKEIDS